MSRPRVVVTHWVHSEILDLLLAEFDVSANRSSESLPREEILRRCREARAILAFMPDRIDAAFLERCPKLGIVAGAMKGVDNIDVEACSSRGVWVTAVPDLLTEPTAELGITLLLALIRRVVEGDHHVRSGAFQGWRPILYGSSLSSRTVGLVGMGAVGQAIAARLAGFSCRLLYHDVRPLAREREQELRVEHLTLEGLLESSDHVLLAVPLTQESRHLISAPALAHAKPGLCLVNVGRGSVVDEGAVASALRSGRLGGYAADVFTMEDQSLPERPRAIPDALLAPDLRTVFTPHLGSAVDEVRCEIARSAAESILQVHRGEVPRHAVNRLSAAVPGRA